MNKYQLISLCFLTRDMFPPLLIIVGCNKFYEIILLLVTMTNKNQNMLYFKK
jgi:hypothetical protein